MAFSLAGFGAGFASKAASRLDEERVRSEKLQDEARQNATRQRLAKQAKRDQEKALAEEMASQLSLYFSPEQASAIMGKGLGAAKEALRMSGDLVSKGYSPQPLFNLSSATNMSDEDSSEMTAAVASSPQPVGTVTQASQKTDLEATSTSSNSFVNLDYYLSSMKPADDEQATLDAAYAVAVQKSINGKTAEIRNKQASYAAELLTQIKKKDAALSTDEEGASSPFSKSTIDTMLKTQMKLALQENDFSVDLEGRLAEKIGGRVAQYNVSVIQANTNLRILNTGEDNTPMSTQLNVLTKDNVANAVKKIQLDARKQHSSDSQGGIADRRVNMDSPFERYVNDANGKEVDMLQVNAKKGMYKIGDIVYTTVLENGVPITRLQVYTGIALNSRHNNFIDAGTI
jgi:hypothetical protein